MADEDPVTFGELRDALIPPGSDKDAVWAALKGAEVKGPAKAALLGKIAEFHQTGGHQPGGIAPDVSVGKAVTSGSPVTEEDTPRCKGCGGGCMSGGTYVPHHQYCGKRGGEPYTPLPGSQPVLKASMGTTCAPCNAIGILADHVPGGDECRMVRAVAEKRRAVGAPAAVPQMPADPFDRMTPGAVAATAMHEAVLDLMAGGFDKDDALTIIARAYAAANRRPDD